MEFHTGHYLDGRKEHFIVEDNNNSLDEVVRINASFFQKSYNKKRTVLKLLIWWSVKHYFKIIFK